MGSTRQKPVQQKRTQSSRIAPRRVEAAPRGRSLVDLERRRLERRCEELRAEIDDAEVARGELLGVLSHDIRNPLSVILMSTRLLARRLEVEPSSRRSMDALARAAEEINRFADDLSDAGRIDAGRFTVTCNPEALGPLIDDALAVTRPLAETKALRVERAVEGDIPPMPLDRERILRVLTGLVANAIRFTPKAGAITVRATTARGEVRVAVTDSGAGISEAERAQLFTLPKSSRTPPTQGVGLPLYVARGIVEAHGGRLRLESEPGRGTTFSFTLPLH